MSKRNYSVLLLLLLCTIGVYAQELRPVAQRVQQVREQNNELHQVTGLIVPNEKVDRNRLSKEIKQANYFSFSTDKVKELLDTPVGFITLEIKNTLSGQANWNLDLVEVESSYYDFSVENSNGEVTGMSPKEGRFFRGVIRGLEKESVVAFSVFPEEIIGIVSIDGEGNYNIARLKNESTHILYNENDLVAQHEFSCETKVDEAVRYKSEVLKGINLRRAASVANKCVKLYFETEYDMFQNKGNLVNVRNYVAGLFNSVATIYQNENIKTEISTIKVWTSNDPYTATNTASLLNQFKVQISSFNGHLGQLLTFRSVGGGRAAGFSGLCNSNVDNKLSVSGIHSSHSIFPTYSWTIYVVTHEFGHLFGSRHTHACVWNGNSTAIDGCANFTEGSCSVPGYPSGGGTIMSYCHLRPTGINFNKGFGSQPGNVIRNRVANASCVGNCCPVNRFMYMNFISGTFDYEASNTIYGYSSNTIKGAANITYDAGKSVRLLNGFRVVAGAKFNAFIDGCGGARKTDNTSADEEITSIETIEDQLSNLVIAKLYPNPTRGQFTIEFEKLETEIQIEVISFMGATVYSMEGVTEQRVDVDLSDFAKGVYMVKISSNGKSFVKKVIYQ